MAVLCPAKILGKHFSQAPYIIETAESMLMLSQPRTG